MILSLEYRNCIRWGMFWPVLGMFGNLWIAFARGSLARLCATDCALAGAEVRHCLTVSFFLSLFPLLLLSLLSLFSHAHTHNYLDMSLPPCVLLLLSLLND